MTPSSRGPCSGDQPLGATRVPSGSGLSQIHLVLGEGPVLEQVLGVPGAGRNVPFPTVAAENVLTGAGGPAARLFAKGLARGNATGFLGDHNEVDQRKMAFGQVSGFGAPVIHLDV